MLIHGNRLWFRALVLEGLKFKSFYGLKVEAAFAAHLWVIRSWS